MERGDAAYRSLLRGDRRPDGPLAAALAGAAFGRRRPHRRSWLRSTQPVGAAPYRRLAYAGVLDHRLAGRPFAGRRAQPLAAAADDALGQPAFELHRWSRPGGGFWDRGGAGLSPLER